MISIRVMTPTVYLPAFDPYALSGPRMIAAAKGRGPGAEDPGPVGFPTELDALLTDAPLYGARYDRGGLDWEARRRRSRPARTLGYTH